MLAKSINTINDVYELKQASRESLDKISVNTATLKYSGLLRHICKYAFFKLNINGILEIVDEPFVAFSASTKRMDFWQVRSEVFSCGFDRFEELEVSNEKGLIRLKKIKKYERSNGITYGIVYSGADKEKESLCNCIESVIVNHQSLENYEILVCTSPGSDMSFINENYSAKPVSYFEIDTNSPAGRIMICKKKNALYERASFSTVVICHTRILFQSTFAKKILEQDFEFCTTAIYHKKNNEKEKYLDFAFIRSYDELKRKFSSRALGGAFINKDYLYWFKKRVASIDGGLNIFNKNLIPSPPYNDRIAWGEAEDTEMSARLYWDGYLIDYFPEIENLSSTNKLIKRQQWIKSYYRSMVNYLKKKQILF